jgi:subtilisin family serine protease
MMRRTLVLLILLLLSLLPSAIPTGAQSYPTSGGGDSLLASGLIEGETVVTLPDMASYEHAVNAGSYLGARVINSYAPMRMLRLEYPIRKALADGEFHRLCAAESAAISPNYIRHAHLVPDDPRLSKQTYLNPIEARDGWDLHTGNASITIGLIDTGIDVEHPDLQANLLGGINLRAGEEPTDISDPHGHGTAVAGIIGATTDNGIGIAGLCWRVKLLSIKVLGGDELSTTLFEEAAAIDYAVSAGVQIINMSFGGAGTSSVEETAIRNAVNAGVMLVASAGNDGEYGDRETAPQGLNYPAGFAEVIGVGALTHALEKAEFSNYGQDQCEFVAVGEGVYTTLPVGLGEIIKPILKGRDYGLATGTSFAAPQVTGLIALLRMKEPWLTRARVINRLRENARSMEGPDYDGDGVNDNLGYGLIQCRDVLADSPVGRNEALKAGAFVSPIFPEQLSVYVRTLKAIDAGSLKATARPEDGPAVSFKMVSLEPGGYLGTIIWPPGRGAVEIEIGASSGGMEYPFLVITHEPQA